MKQAILIFAILALVTIKAFAINQPDYYGSESTEAVIKFNYFVETSNQADEQMAKLLIDKQLTFLFGAYSNNEFQAVPKGDQKVVVLRTEKNNNLFRIYYQYQGTAVVTKGAPENYTFPLPRNPNTIYQRSLVKNNGRIEYKCNTDYEHTEETYFWYFWNPFLDSCPMVEGQDFDLLTAKLVRKNNTVQTYPEYARLADQGVIRVDLLMGQNDESQNANPFQSQDIAAGNYRNLHNQLLSMGYAARVWNDQEIRAVAPTSRGGDAFMETLTKKTATTTIEIRFFFGGTSTYAARGAASPFQYFMKDALENADVYLYAGHSGLGEYLDLQRIENLGRFEIKMNPIKYQIYFFNGCSSYPYYNSMYFNRKGGTKNLDILTNGLATLFSSINSSSMALIMAIDTYASTGKRTSYQSIINQGDSNNLLGINGDEDNN